MNISNTTVTTSTSDTQTGTSTCPDNNAPKGPQVHSKVGIRQRLKHFTFAWFLCTMSTGGLAIALAETPHKFRGLYTIGVIVFIFDLIVFLLFSACMLARLIFHPAHFKKIILHPPESFFIGAYLLSISVILGCIQLYGITHGPAYPWLLSAIYVLYWLYAAVSLLNSISQYYILIAHSTLRPVPFAPSMFLPGYSAMLTGTIASVIAGSQPGPRAEMVIISGLAFKGYGWLISSVCIVYFVRLLLDKGLPPPPMRPALFIPVGSLAYTIVALIGLANAIPDTGYFARHPLAKEILTVTALFVSIFMWLFAFWVFAIAVVANVSCAKNMPFALAWWAFIFPNVGFMLSTSMIGKELESEAILWVASVMTIGLVAIWLIAAVACVKAVWVGTIMWPGKDEDKDL
ncbi:voltage-dependent anion channel [Phaeosphaeria sp. MPI-PUGE-AT-0046c]|nr:voltage-dependent anion channel [Phaeosphaeria sp. MPI-PUGE-AT-0046c]